MDLTVFQQISLIFGALCIGALVAWKIRERRINTLEQLLYSYQEKVTQLEMEYGNLEAYVEYHKNKYLGNSRKPSSSPRQVEA